MRSFNWISESWSICSFWVIVFLQFSIHLNFCLCILRETCHSNSFNICLFVLCFFHFTQLFVIDKKLLENLYGFLSHYVLYSFLRLNEFCETDSFQPRFSPRIHPFRWFRFLLMKQNRREYPYCNDVIDEWNLKITKFRAMYFKSKTSLSENWLHNRKL